MAAPTLNIEKFKKNYGYGTPTWSPLYHEVPEGGFKQSENLVGGVLLPPLFRTVDNDAITNDLAVLKGKVEEEDGVEVTRPRLGWSAQETAVGCRIRDYGSGVPHWSPLYGGSEWRKGEIDKDQLSYKSFKTGVIQKRPSDDPIGQANPNSK